jgi:oligopeptide transport system substrate-binding protein
MEPPNRQILALASIILLAVVLSGCGLPLPFPQPTSEPKLPDAQQIFHSLEGGAHVGNVDTFDPALIQFRSDADKAQLVFPQLVTLDEDQQPVDWAAESHEISADGLTYTFHLRKGMTWADGTPIDAATFAYSINRTVDPCTGSYVAPSYLVALAGAETFHGSVCPVGAIRSPTTLIGASIQASDPLTLRLQLAHPAGYFLAALTYPTSWAVPQALVERYVTPVTTSGVASSTWTEHLTDNGPFGGNLYLLTKWQQTDPSQHVSLTFDRNDRFWGNKPLLRRIEYTLYPRASDAWTEFKQAGKGDVGVPAIDSTVTTPGSLVDEISAARTLKGVSIQQTPWLVLYYLSLHWDRAPFDDVRMRQAFSLALDRQAIAHEVFHDGQQPTIHLVPEGAPGYNADLADAAGRTGVDALKADLAAARSLANAYAADKCGGALDRCPAVTMVEAITSPTTMKLANLMKQQWEAAFPSLSITIRILDRSGQPIYHQIVRDGWGADYPDPQEFLSVLWTSHASLNYTAVSSGQVDALCAQADGMADLPARIPVYQQAEQALVTQGAAIPFAQPFLTYAVRTHLVGWRVAATGATPLSVWQMAYLRR